jgi:hypothetical protein
VLEPEHLSTLTSVGNLAFTLRCQGKYEQAEQIGRRALEGRQKRPGPKHPDTLKSVSILAAVLGAQGKYEKGEQMHRRALEGRRRVLGQEHPDTLRSINNLTSMMRARQGKTRGLMRFLSQGRSHEVRDMRGFRA